MTTHSDIQSTTRGHDLAANRPGASALAAARAQTTWWRRIGRLCGIHTQDMSWRVGAKGERKVGRTLRLARPFGWRALHAVPVGSRGSDIDHVLIGPGGVVTLNTKHHRGQRVKAGRFRIFVGGQQTRYAQHSQHEARRASRLIAAATGRPITVTSAVVIVGARRLRGSQTDGIPVLTRTGLLIWLLRRPHTLTKTERNELFELARRSTVWRP
jgi:Nuclease-related domain